MIGLNEKSGHVAPTSHPGIRAKSISVYSKYWFAVVTIIAVPYTLYTFVNIILVFLATCNDTSFPIKITLHSSDSYTYLISHYYAKYE